MTCVTHVHPTKAIKSCCSRVTPFNIWTIFRNRRLIYILFRKRNSFLNHKKREWSANKAKITFNEIRLLGGCLQGLHATDFFVLVHWWLKRSRVIWNTRWEIITAEAQLKNRSPSRHLRSKCGSVIWTIFERHKCSLFPVLKTDSQAEKQGSWNRQFTKIIPDLNTVFGVKVCRSVDAF